MGHHAVPEPGRYASVKATKQMYKKTVISFHDLISSSDCILKSRLKLVVAVSTVPTKTPSWNHNVP